MKKHKKRGSEEENKTDCKDKGKLPKKEMQGLSDCQNYLYTSISLDWLDTESTTEIDITQLDHSTVSQKEKRASAEKDSMIAVYTFIIMYRLTQSEEVLVFMGSADHIYMLLSLLVATVK